MTLSYYTDARAEPWIYRVASILVRPEMVVCIGRTVRFTMARDIPRLGERIGVAGSWVEFAGGFVKIIATFGSLAPPESIIPSSGSS